MGRPSIRVKLTTTSKDDDPSTNPRTFNRIPDASSATGLTDRGIRAAYHSKRELMQKRLGEVYNLKWEEPDPIRAQHVRKPTKKCNKCSKDLTPEDRSAIFTLYPGGDYDIPLTFISLYRASKKTDISICTLRNACSKANMKITQQKWGEQRYEVLWTTVCFDCCPKTKKELLWEIS